MTTGNLLQDCTVFMGHAKAFAWISYRREVKPDATRPAQGRSLPPHRRKTLKRLGCQRATRPIRRADLSERSGSLVENGPRVNAKNTRSQAARVALGGPRPVVGRVRIPRHGLFRDVGRTDKHGTAVWQCFHCYLLEGYTLPQEVITEQCAK